MPSRKITKKRLSPPRLLTDVLWTSKPFSFHFILCLLFFMARNHVLLPKWLTPRQCNGSSHSTLFTCSLVSLQGKQEDGDVCREAARVGLVWRLPSCLWRHPTPFRGKASALHLCPLADCPASHHPLLLLLVRKTAGSTLLTIYYGSSSSSSSSISTLLKASDQPRLPPSPISLSTVTRSIGHCSVQI